MLAAWSCFYSLLREIGSLTEELKVTEAKLGWFLFALTRDRVTDIGGFKKTH